MGLAAISVIVMFSLMQILLVASMTTRIAGKLSNKPSLGTSMQQTIIVGSSVFLIIILPVLALLIESRISEANYLKVVIFSHLLSFLGSLLIFVNLNFVQRFFQKIFNFYDIHHRVPEAIFWSFFRKDNVVEINLKHRFKFKKIIYKKFLLSLFSYALLANGFFLAFLLAMKYSEYRLTISQFNTAFQGIGAFMIAFYIEPMLSRSIDKLDEPSWTNNTYSVILGRVFGFFLSVFLYLIYLLINV